MAKKNRKKYLHSSRYKDEEATYRAPLKEKLSEEEALKKNKRIVEDWYDYFRDNNMRYKEFISFVCSSTISASEMTANVRLQKPNVEFNVLEAYVSRLRDEFSRNEPSFKASAADGIDPGMIDEKFIATERFIEGHIRAIFNESTNDGLQADIYRDTLMGGFSGVYIHTEYINDYSFEQKIVVERVFDPTMMIFDPMARLSHKGDGKYCGMLVPYTYERFKDEFGEEVAKQVNFNATSNIGGFQWSYTAKEEKVILVAYLFKKVFKKRKIYKLSNGVTVPKENYDKLVAMWDGIEQLPVILDERTVNKETIVLCQFCESKELSYIETDYEMLPIIFIDGNSVLVDGSGGSAGQGRMGSSGLGGNMGQMTRPYVYHAKGAQRAKNFAAQSQLAFIENLTNAQFKVPLQALPTNQQTYLNAYTNPQTANILVYNQFDDKTGERLDPPMEVVKQQVPSIVQETFVMMTSTIQDTLGSYDAQQGIQAGAGLSGKAIMQGAMQSDSAAGPYRINYIKGWNRIGEVVMHLMPRVYRTPRSIPIIDEKRKPQMQAINQADNRDSISADFEAYMYQIKIESNVNSAIQKQIALDQMIRCMGVSETFSRFINSKGLTALIENMDLPNQDQFLVEAQQFMQEETEAAQIQQQMMMEQPTEMEVVQQVEMAKVQQRAEQASGELAIKSAEVAIDKEKLDLDYLKFLADTEESANKAALEEKRLDAEQSRTAVELAMDLVELQHDKKES